MPRSASGPDLSQLSLFGEPVSSAPAREVAEVPPARPVVPRGDERGAREPAGSPLSPRQVEPRAQVPAATLAPAVFRHPQAQREIRLGDHLVAYAFRRARRRSIGFVVGVEGLSVSAPKWVNLGDVDVALREKGDWILRKLGEQQQRQQRLQAAKIDWRDGTCLPFLGETVLVVLDARAGLTKAGAVLNTNTGAAPGEPKHRLHIGLPPTAAPEQIRDVVQSWLQRQARRVFEERCRHFADQLQVRYTRLSLSSAQTRWGSASANGSIRLNWRLIHFAMPTIDYVVAHELAHLREMNHSPRFWDVVRSVVPDYERARGTLKDDVLPVFE